MPTRSLPRPHPFLISLRTLLALLLAASLARAQTTATTAIASTSSTQPTASKGPIDVYLIGGQSNATGQGYLANLPKDFKIDTRVLLFNSGRPHLNSGAEPMTWLPMRQASESPDRFGPEIGFANRIQELEPDRHIAIIKHAHSGTNLYAQWNPGANAEDKANWGPQFLAFVATVDAGMKGLQDQGYQPAIKGMLWQQGENDANTTATAMNYGANLTHFIARVREQYHVPGMRFVYGYVLPFPNAQPGRPLVRMAEHDLDQGSGSPIAVKGAFVVETDDLDHRAADPNTKYPQDHLHFGTDGTLKLGIRMADKMHEDR